MNVDSNNMEFGNELFAVLPYAYWHYKNGLLGSTRSAVGSEPFYYFSQIHIVNRDMRYSGNIWTSDIPNKSVHEFTGEGIWMAPPYKAKYMNKEYVYDKPILVIANKYNNEWNAPPVNFLDLVTLLNIIDRLYDKYQIFYNRMIPDRLTDDQKHMDLGEHVFIRRLFPKVRFIHEIKGNYNLNQLRIYANCDRFISVQGGNSILCSYFGGTNIVYAVRGNELNGGFYGKLDKLSGCNVVHIQKDILREVGRYETT